MLKDSYPMFVTAWAIDEPRVAIERALLADREVVPLPAPRAHGGRPLLDALKDRRSSREFSPRPLSAQLLSDLLWCAFGVNRPAIHGRTAPSAQNWQEISINIAASDGLLEFDATAHALLRVSRTDIRASAGLQPHAATAPLTLIYVADFMRATDATEEEKRLYCVANTGFIAQNVYLFCASEGLATVVCGAIDRPLLSHVMGLGAHERVILAQSVGYPADTV